MAKALRAPQVETPGCQQNWEQLAGLFPVRNADLANQACFGYVSSGGTIGLAGTGDWTVSRGGVGTYTVTYNTPFAAAPMVVAMPANTGVAAAIKGSGGTAATAMVFFAYVAATGAAADMDFMFIAIGPR